MPKKWFPLAVLTAIGGAFALWWSMDDYERARYFGILSGIPHTAFTVAGLAGISGELEASRIVKFRSVTK